MTGSLPLEQRIENRRRVIGGVLTAREHHVLTLAAEGHTNREIADHMQISRSTVAEGLARVIERLGAKGRVHCIGLARSRGLLDERPTR
jgi:DNA-binding CsgD family transcriptional regulator